MKRRLFCLPMVLAIFVSSTFADDDSGWVSLFNGKDLAGWKISEHPDSFRVDDGVLVVNGPRAHAF